MRLCDSFSSSCITIENLTENEAMGGEMSFDNGPEHEGPETAGDVYGDARMPRPEDCIPYELWHSEPQKLTPTQLDELAHVQSHLRLPDSAEPFETIGDTLGDTSKPDYDRPLLAPDSLARMEIANTVFEALIPAAVEKAMAIIGSDPKLLSLVRQNLDGFIGTDTVKRDATGVYPCSIDISGPVNDRSYKCVLHLPTVEKSEPAQIASAICLLAKYAELGRQGRSDWRSPDIRIAALEVQQEVLSRFGGDSKWVKHQLEGLGAKLSRYREELASVV